jgi:Uma2 family endonuclease
MTWLTVYRGATPGVRTVDNATLRLDRENVLQPDACLWVESSGRAWIDKDDYLAGAPELVVEIAASSAAHDLHDKLRVYRRNGVQEYLVLVAYEREVRWFNWQTGEDREIMPDDDGMLRSLRFPGLWLDPARFWQGEVAGLLAALQQGLAARAATGLMESAG